LKVGWLGERRADLYVHLSDKTSAWDACAPEAILRAAGGVFVDLGGSSIEYSGTELANKQDETGIRASMQQIDQLLARETERGIPAERQFLAGFSQGGAITLSMLVRRREMLAGAVALSTYLPLADHAEREFVAEATRIPLFLAHGSMDPVVPQGLGLMSREWLTRHGFQVDWHSYPMPHSVSMDEIRHLTQWLDQRLRAAA